ncbi:hypothetical protein BOTBODRAFT_37364 [Botryobasidium botryosum FD-172 SS1]|uniref:Uncharacterized protein n=1 Tax=Botryobasidium botryosum (strain FD-172 SS1) TaxID=930990 RepID=A0A067M329_BOTB1|nr:hypothetical protein BOTBODRAFT_37364 [Botryobasidium botryosum FD-172 SS1]
MDTTATTLIPRLVQQLCEQALQSDALGDHENAWKLPVHDLHTLFRLPNTTGCGPIDHMDREAKTLSLVCQYATRALSSFIESMSAEIRNRRNQLLPIYRIPNEILAMMFQCTVDDEATRAMPLRQKAPFNVSYVSRRWRNVAIDTPRLWKKYDTTNAHIANIVIDRSKHVPLDIELVISPTHYVEPGDGDPWELRYPTPYGWTDPDVVVPIAFDLLQPLLPHVHRWGAIVLDGVDDDQLQMCLPGEPAPNLQQLHIIKNGPVMDSEAISRIPLFNGSTPLLRDLHLSCLTIPLASSLYVGLTSLKLEYLSYEDAVMPFLLTIGAGCPLLEHLILRQIYWGGRLRSASRGGNPPISLPRLKELKLWWLKRESLYVILSSIVSPDAQLYIQVDAQRVENKLDIFPFTGFLSNIPPTCWMYFTLLQDEPWGGRHLALDAGDFVRGRFVRFVRTLIPMGSTDQLISYFAQNLPRSLESLALEAIDATFFTITGFTQLLTVSPTITSLTLSNCPWPFVEALIVGPDAHLCPLLEELRLQGFRIVNETLLAVGRSRTVAGGRPGPHTAGGTTRLTRIVLSQCTGLDAPTLSALRSLPLEVHVLEPDSRVEQIRYNYFRG